MATRKKEFPCAEDLNAIAAKAKAKEEARRLQERKIEFDNLLWATATNLKAAAGRGERDMVTDVSYHVHTHDDRDQFFKVLEGKGYKVDLLPCTQYQVKISW